MDRSYGTLNFFYYLLINLTILCLDKYSEYYLRCTQQLPFEVVDHEKLKEISSMKKQLKYIVPICISLVFIGCAEVNTPTLKQKNPVLPAITKTDTHKHYSGKFVWHDLVTDDIASSQSFYANLFGWSFEKKDKYTLISNHGKLIGGMMEVTPTSGKKTESIWLPTMSVANVDSAVAYVKGKKGKILNGPIDMKERGRGVLVSDPNGAHIVLLHSKSGDPVDATPQTGDWLWNELWTNKPKKSYDFYRKLGHYDTSKQKDNYRLLKHKGTWRAGIRDVSDEDVKVHWVPVIRVSDPKAVTAKAVKFGGKVLLEPKKSFMNGNVAIIVDNRGALVIVQRWTEGDQL